ncbi:hypothetical protein GJ744_000742 [Endocarpon pusillum]|uniref:Uncharacterized protein n=1 Tax=Endocarpon pusillum TaxID=364733 RepID=A0A8H7E1P0_9EURO|nr:hypothetical protein GJ744_000742 [Endocarpon pusillum]
MGCLGCCDSEENCVTKCFGRRRPSGSPEASLSGQAPQNSHQSCGIATITPVVEPHNEKTPQVAQQVTSPRPQPVRHARAEEGSTSGRSSQNPSRGNDIVTDTTPTPARRQYLPQVSSNAFAKRRAGPSRTNPPRTLGSQCDPNHPANARVAQSVNPVKPFTARDQHFARVDSPRPQPCRSAISINPRAARSWESHSATLTRRPTVALSALTASSQQRFTRTSEEQPCSIREDDRGRTDGSSSPKGGSSGFLRSSPRKIETLVQHPSSYLGLRTAATSRVTGPSGASASRRNAEPSVGHEGEYRFMRLGIESEFFLAALSSEHDAAQPGSFVNILASNYNRAVGYKHPRMHRTLAQPYSAHNYSKWTMADEPSLDSREKSPWPLEMISPIFDVYPLSGWRRHVIATWNFLEQHYSITTRDSCATHLHVSLVPHYDLKDLKRVAVSIIHFEPAFEALMPEARRGNPFCQSNWLDSPCLAPAGLSRSESIAEIERKLDAYDVITSIQNGGDKCFAWNFESLREHAGLNWH